MPLQRIRLLALGGLLLTAIASIPLSARAQSQGCAPELGAKLGAQLVAQVFERDSAGSLRPLGERGEQVEVRSGQLLRLYVRPVDGPYQPEGYGCQVRVNSGRLNGVARMLTTDGFVFAGSMVYGQFRPGEERVLDFQIKSFDDWSSPTEQIEVENVAIVLPETGEFVAGLPAPVVPPAGTVCADVVYPDTRPAAGVLLGLSVPPNGPTDRRPVGANGRVCWEGFDEQIFGEVSVDPAVDPALGQPRSRYVSREANYRLFVVKRPR